ncbi:MAG TPA: cytochrome c oxidase subunit II [Anaerolineae bacterium]|nr:cytochrome c oxidase subunit II [Anaerolineae bacterium]
MKHFIVAGLLVIVVAALLILGLNALDLVPNLASEEGGFVDQMFQAQIYVIAFIFSLIVVLMLYSVVVFRRKPGDTGDGAYIKGNVPLEITWTIIPLIVVMGFGVWGAVHLNEITAGAPDELVVEVTGFQYGWRFDYPDYDFTSNELYLPRGRQILFNITSQDVIHSFWVPEFRIKQDAVPGRWTTLRVTPTEVGDYRIRCAELCGYAHTAMYAPVVVVEPDDFESWVAGQEVAVPPPGEMAPAELGARLVSEQGCLSCHSIDGSILVGPSWLGLYGSERQLEDGSTVVADDTYLLNAILNPGDQVVTDYPNIMPAAYSFLSDEELSAVVEYIKTLNQ